MIVFNRKVDLEYKEFHERLVTHEHVKRWWHYLRSCYLIGTDWSSEELSDHFTTTADALGIPNTHLVMAVDLSDSQGMLTEKAWSWIQRNAKRQSGGKDQHGREGGRR